MDISNITGEILQDISASLNEDYEKDGYLICGKCGKRKGKLSQNSKGEKLTLPIGKECTCDVKRLTPEEEEEIRKEQEAKRKAEMERRAKEEKEARLVRIDLNRRKAFDDVRLRQWTFENDDKANEAISSVAQKYADNFYTMLGRGKGLLLYGGVGTGKSFIAACIVNEVLKQEYSCRFTNFSRLANMLLGCEFGEKQEYLDSLQRYQLLVIDDLGSERGTEFMNEVVYSVIDARQVSQLPLIVTTNLTGDELKHPKDIHSERVFSRLFEMCIPVEVKGKDRRKLKLRDSDKDLKEMLGLL